MLTEKERRLILDVVDDLVDLYQTTRHPSIAKLLEVLDAGPDVQEDGE